MAKTYNYNLIQVVDQKLVMFWYKNLILVLVLVFYQIKITFRFWCTLGILNCTTPIPELKLNPKIKLLVLFNLIIKNTKSFISGFSFSFGIGAVQLTFNLKCIAIIEKDHILNFIEST